MHCTLMRKCLAGLTLAAGAAFLTAGAAENKTDKEEGFKTLFNGKDLDSWKLIVSGKADPKETFQVKDGIIVVSGHPNGYFYTDKPYKNYVLRFEWRYPKKAGNSGCLVHIQEPHKVWPKCVEVQGQFVDHGKIFAIGGAKGTFTFDGDTLKKVRRPVGEEWNTTEVVSQDGMLTSKVNGSVIGTGKGDLVEGIIGFQSEGEEIHFKNIRIKTAD